MADATVAACHQHPAFPEPGRIGAQRSALAAHTAKIGCRVSEAPGMMPNGGRFALTMGYRPAPNV